ncbi:hypothetical protein [Nocardia sp. CDC160]|uniref:hypothetical protein n=1 Tax=Nocardia sp. CDC160 TaxID=3112166 RepID=UPI002DB74E79|nr:hypothetical protein [Nocardia sp. CDC160]MEC3915961.1 hypothetical protein [Nocardia sp. CDC160]
MTDQLVSPQATGGAGFVFEYHVATLLFSKLLRGAHVPVGIDLPLSRVALQQRNRGFPLDDVVAFADSQGSSVSLEFQVKRRLQVTAGDPDFAEVMRSACAVVCGYPLQVADGSRQLGLVAAESTPGLAGLAELTSIARAHAATMTFGDLFRPRVTKKPLRDRLDEIADVVARVCSLQDKSDIDGMTHRVLKALHVWQVDVGHDNRDWRAELDGLIGLTTGSGITPANLLASLRELAEEYGTRSGDVDAPHLRAAMRSRVGVDLRLPRLGHAAPRSVGIVVNNYGNGPTIMAEGDQLFHGNTFNF